MTYLSLLIIIIVFSFFLAFPVELAIIDIYIYATLNTLMMMMTRKISSNLNNKNYFKAV